MKEINALRLFEELRLHPWKDSDKLIIDAHLAMLSVTNPKEAVAMTKRYADKLDQHEAQIKGESIVEVSASVEEPVTVTGSTEVALAPVKKKRGRKPLSPSDNA